MFLIDIEEHTDGFRTNRNRLKSTKLKGLKGIVAKKKKSLFSSKGQKEISFT